MNSTINFQRQTSNVIMGTSLQGYVTATYDQLVEAFGEPEVMDGSDKLYHQWVLKIEGLITTIYDYKENLNTGKAEEWHVGGNYKACVLLVNSILAG